MRVCFKYDKVLLDDSGIRAFLEVIVLRNDALNQILQ